MSGWQSAKKDQSQSRKSMSVLGFLCILVFLAGGMQIYRKIYDAPADAMTTASLGTDSTNLQAENGNSAPIETVGDRNNQTKRAGEAKVVKSDPRIADFISVSDRTLPSPLIGAKGVVRWLAPEGPALALLESGRAKEALTWVNLNAVQGLGVESEADVAFRERCAVLAARAVAFEDTVKAKERFEKILETAKSADVRADALFGSALCSAGAIARIPAKALEEIRRLAPRSWGAAQASFEAAQRLEQAPLAGQEVLEKARAMYQEALTSERLPAAYETVCEKRWNELTEKLVLAPGVKCAAPAAVIHTVQAGENLTTIARKYKVEPGQMTRLNPIRADSPLRLGQRLKVLPGSAKAVVRRGRLTISLYIDDVLLRRRPICIGPDGKTPLGKFRIENRKAVNPVWYYEGKVIPFGDSRNILGTRWLPFDSASENGIGNGIGIHGTTVPETIPGRVSAGCIRMYNADVEEFYDFLPVGSTVEVTD
jgi:LysM repeat protein